MQIRNLLLEQQRKLFVGRKEELRILAKVYDNPDAAWQLLNIYGPSGIGKTTLLRIFASKIGARRCIYLDGHCGFTRSEDFLKQIILFLHGKSGVDRSAAGLYTIENYSDAINRYAIEHNGLFILFDTFEQVGLIEDWLRTEFLPALHPYVKVCFAGRYPLEGPWLRDGWNLLVSNVKLKPLTSTEMTEYANAVGIKEPEILTALIRFSRGLPLTLSMACEVLTRQGKSTFLNNIHQQQIISTLVTELLKDIKQPALMHYLEIATVVWRFDQDLFQSILGEPVPTNQFREFCKLPFITRLGDSWLLHDSIRQWAAMDFETRKPNTYHLYRHRAMHALLEKEKAANHKMEYSMDKIFLHENRFVRSLGFSMVDELIMRECIEQDLTEIENLFFRFLSHHAINGADDLSLGHLIRPLWEADPSSVLGLWKEDKVVSLGTCIPLHKKTMDLLQNNPITSPIVSKVDPTIPHYLICVVGFEPTLEEEISGSLARAFIRTLTKRAIFLNLLMMPKWSPLISLLGFERAPWGDSTSSQGIQYIAYQIDLREEEYFTKFERSVTSLPDPTQTEQGSIVPTFEETIQNIKHLLKHYSELPNHTGVVNSLLHLLPNRFHEQPFERKIYQLQNTIELTLDELSQRSEEDGLFSQIIRLAYIERIGPHEHIAERLNLSVPTYYRHLKKAIHRLVFLLMDPNPNNLD